MADVLLLTKAIDDYTGELARRGRSKETRRAYERILFLFADRYPERAVEELGEEECTRFLDRWVDASPATIALGVSVLNGFFSYLWERKRIRENPMARVRRPPRKRPEDLEVVTLTGRDVEQLFEATETVQELLCVALLAYLGPRRKAAALARRRDVDFERQTIRFREKGGKFVEKPLPAQLLEILLGAERFGVWASGEDYLIPNRRPEAVRRPERSDKVVWETVKRVAERAGIRAHVHALRAAFAVRYLETHPGDREALQMLMGHTRADTTEVYLRKLNRAKAMERVRDLDWGVPGLRSVEERRIRDSNPCYRRERAAS